MFIRNRWYVVAWDHEIPADGLFARTVIGEPLVLHRTAAGEIVALQHRCCHRLALQAPQGGSPPMRMQGAVDGDQFVRAAQAYA